MVTPYCVAVGLGGYRRGEACLARGDCGDTMGERPHTTPHGAPGIMGWRFRCRGGSQTLPPSIDDTPAGWYSRRHRRFYSHTVRSSSRCFLHCTAGGIHPARARRNTCVYMSLWASASMPTRPVGGVSPRFPRLGAGATAGPQTPNRPLSRRAGLHRCRSDGRPRAAVSGVSAPAPWTRCRRSPLWGAGTA